MEECVVYFEEPPLIPATLFMLLSLIALILSLLRVGKFMWEPRYFRTTAVSIGVA